MPNKRLKVLTLQDLQSQDIKGTIPILLEIYNPDISWGTEEERAGYGQDNGYLRLIADTNKVVYKGKTYLPSNFEFVFPETDGSKIGNTSVSISALDKRVSKLLKSIDLTSEVEIVAMYSRVEKESDKYIYKFVPIQSCSFEMTSANKSGSTATFSVTYDRATAQNVPYDIATKDRVPAINDEN